MSEKPSLVREDNFDGLHAAAALDRGDGATGRAFGQGKGGAPLMTVPTGFPFFHLGHGDWTVPPRLEQAGVAFAAYELFCVGGMNKNDVSGRLDAEGDVPDRMAAPAGG